MNTPCAEFRSLLEQRLEARIASGPQSGSPSGSPSGSIGELAWHEHLLACEDCRELLQLEEALDVLLESLPDPRLPAHLARRVLARLRALRDAAAQAPPDSTVEPRMAEFERDLDQLLALAGDVQAPERLSQSVLAGLRSARTQARVDALLDLESAPVPAPGLALRVLARLRAERTPTAVAGRSRAARTRWLAGAAAGPLVLLLGWAVWRAQRAHEGAPAVLVQEPAARGGAAEARSTDRRAGGGSPVGAQHGAADAQMLAALDVLEQWDLLMQDDVDVLLSTVDPVDDVLLEYEQGEPAAKPADETPDAAAHPSKG